MRTIGTLVLALLTPLGRALSAQLAIDTTRPVGTIDGIVRDTAITLTPVGGAAAYGVASMRLSGCRTELFVDGVRLPERTTTDDLSPPKEIAGIEVYAGPATIPPQFAGGRSSCGVVLIWTRYGA
jgi:hypothetical protein